RAGDQTPSITSDALMMTVTSMPAARLRLLAESRVIDDIALYVDNLAGDLIARADLHGLSS
ncbi:MAG: hypothetical protein RLO49_13390, partial [Rhodospirillales bacterium]